VQARQLLVFVGHVVSDGVLSASRETTLSSASPSVITRRRTWRVSVRRTSGFLECV
jgi:hypothetical protein